MLTKSLLLIAALVTLIHGLDAADTTAHGFVADVERLVSVHSVLGE